MLAYEAGDLDREVVAHGPTSGSEPKRSKNRLGKLSFSTVEANRPAVRPARRGGGRRILEGWSKSEEKGEPAGARQIRTVLTTFGDKVITGMFPGRAGLPKTLIFARRACPERSRRTPRRGYRPHLPRGLRQGQQLLPEDHLPHWLRPHRGKESGRGVSPLLLGRRTAAGRRIHYRRNHLEARLQSFPLRRSSAPFATATIRASPSPWNDRTGTDITASRGSANSKSSRRPGPAKPASTSQPANELREVN